MEYIRIDLTVLSSNIETLHKTQGCHEVMVMRFGNKLKQEPSERHESVETKPFTRIQGRNISSAIGRKTPVL